MADHDDMRTDQLQATAAGRGLVVVEPQRAWSCVACEGTGGLLTMTDPGPLYMACADLDHLVSSPRETPR